MRDESRTFAPCIGIVVLTRSMPMKLHFSPKREDTDKISKGCTNTGGTEQTALCGLLRTPWKVRLWSQQQRKAGLQGTPRAGLLPILRNRIIQHTLFKKTTHPEFPNHCTKARDSRALDHSELLRVK